MNISRSQRARLGVFVAAGAVVLVFFFSLAVGVKLTERMNRFHAYFKGESLSGLEQGAQVKYSGVPVGKVEKISYDPKDLSRVRVVLAVQADFPMKADMSAATGLMGITGLKYIEIMGGTSASPGLKNGAEIPTRTSLISSISGKAEAIAAKVELLINNLNQLTNPDSLKSVRLMLDNVAGITGDVRALTAGLGPRIDSMAASAGQVMGKVDGIAGNVRSITGSFEGALSGGRAASTISSVDSAALALKLAAQNLSMIVKQSHEDFSVSMRNLREASENVNQVTQLLLENPSLLLRNEAPKERSLR